MIPQSTKGEPVGAMIAATRSTVVGFTALQSAKIGLLLLAVSAGTNRCASPRASAGGTMERMKSAAAISLSLAASMPAAAARCAVSALRPASDVRTRMPCSVRRFPTPAPMLPGATIATTGPIELLPKPADAYLMRGRFLHALPDRCRLRSIAQIKGEDDEALLCARRLLATATHRAP